MSYDVVFVILILLPMLVYEYYIIERKSKRISTLKRWSIRLVCIITLVIVLGLGHRVEAVTNDYNALNGLRETIVQEKKYN